MKSPRSYPQPSAFEVCFVSWLALFLGVTAAVFHLVFKPVVVVGKAESMPAREEIGYVEGDTNPELGRAWLQKLQAFREARSIKVSEDELNVAVSHPTERPKVAGEARSSDEDLAIVTGAANFRISGGELQIAVPVKVSREGPVVIVQARGAFVPSERAYRFEPRQFYVGSCPVHRIPLAAPFLLRRIANSQSIPEDLKAVWARLSRVTISGDQLCLNF